MRILVFGDSISQGFFDKDGGWFESLKRCSSKEFTQASDYLTFFNMSISGDFSKNVLARLENELQARVWPGEDQVIIFAVGINDSIIVSGKNAVTDNEFKQNVSSISKIAKTYSPKILFVGLTPVIEELVQPVSWDKNIRFSNDRIELFNGVIQSLCEKNHLKFVDVHHVFKRSKNIQSLFDDGVHPNADGHELIFKTVLPEFNHLIDKS